MKKALASGLTNLLWCGLFAGIWYHEADTIGSSSWPPAHTLIMTPVPDKAHRAP